MRSLLTVLRRAGDQVKRQRTSADYKVLAPPRITEESLRTFCTPTSFEEGRRDFMAGCVSPVVYASDGTLCASVFSLRSLVRFLRQRYTHIGRVTARWRTR